MAASIRQIAEASNVSITTVSRVLRGRGEISDETRRRVQATAARLKYRPNLLVKGLQTGRTQTIGVLMSAEDPFLATIVAGIQDGLAEADHAPLILRTVKNCDGYVGPTELQQIHRLVDRRVDAVILRPVEDAASDDYLREVWDRGLPLVAVDRRLPQSRADFVGSDDPGGAAAAAEHLISLGHRRLAQISGPRFTSTGRERAESFERVIARAPGATCRTLEEPTFRGGQEQAQALLQAADPPTAIFCGNDIIAANVYQTATHLGLRIPQDVSIVGFCDLDFAQWLQPPLTTVRQNGYEIGRQAAGLVLQRLDEELAPKQAQVIRVATQLVIRASTAPRPS